ncbi:asparagine synthase-related protein [Glycomyces dulcitolivorans]|uniref:asparagine synthase-related protein n=1 Tax=Glycomyces dulcitolivorans TaxID=2200759 RepID=UPI000DD2E51C|nr:asparagine synthetase B family protein [Glycomyces dulcitolivorans]
MHTSPPEHRLDFRARPFACGAIGDVDRSLLDELAAQAPARVRTAVDGDRLRLLGSGRLPSWRGRDRRGRWWGALAEGPPPRTWREASEARLAAGVETGDDGAVAVHTDALGMQDLYYRRIGGAVYFAGRIEPLLGLGDSKLHVDWDAWASTLALTGPVGDATPFAEVKRLRAAEAWVWHDGRLRLESFEPSWTSVEPDPGFGPADAVDAVAQVLRAPRRTVLTLSGGWDSRLLGSLAAKRNRRMRAWTTSPDDGLDLDLDYAGPVAEALGVRQQVLVPGEDAWAEDYAEVRERTAFQTTLHTWLMPLCRELHRAGAPVLDGLAGDVLFKALLAPAAPVPEGSEGVRLMWEELEGGRLRTNTLLRPEVLGAFTERSLLGFTAAAGGFAGHHSAATLATLRTRTAKSIAPAPLWLMGPEVALEFPFLHPEVLAAALRVPLGDKIGGGFYRRMLAVADPAVAGLPSTNDPLPEGVRWKARRQASAAALKAATDRIRASATVTGLFTAEARARLLEPADLDPARVKMAHVRVLHWASLFAHWLERYEPVLADDGSWGSAD